MNVNSYLGAEGAAASCDQQSLACRLVGDGAASLERTCNRDLESLSEELYVAPEIKAHDQRGVILPNHHACAARISREG